MPGKTGSTNRECQVTWESGEGQGQIEPAGGTRRVSRGELKQEADSERRRRGFHRFGRKEAPREGREPQSLGDEGRKGADLDVLTSPFRVLAESCGFKVIREDEASDSNSVTSQAGSLVSDCGDVPCDDRHAGSRQVDRVRPRRDTPGLEINAKRTLSCSEEDSTSSGEDADDRPGLGGGNLVLQRQSPICGNQDGDSRRRDKDIRIKNDGRKNDAIALRRHEGISEHGYRAKEKPAYRTRDCHKDDPKQQGKDCKEALKGRHRQSQVDKNESRHTNDPLTCRNGKLAAGQHGNSVKLRDDCVCSAEETESNGTFRTVKETLSPEEADTYRTRNASEKYHRDRRFSDENFSKSRTARNFNESSNFVVQGNQIITNATGCWRHKIVKDPAREDSPPMEAHPNLEETPDKRLAEHDRVNTMAQLGGGKPVKPCHRVHSHSKERNENVKSRLKDENNVDDFQIANDVFTIEHRKPVGGSSYRISRMMIPGPAGQSGGIIRYVRSDPENDDLDLGPKLDGQTEARLGKCPDVDRKQDAFRLGGGDGNMTERPCRGVARQHSESRERKCSCLDKATAEDVPEQSRDGGTCFEKYEIKQGKINTKKCDDHDMQNLLRGRHVIKGGNLQGAKSKRRDLRGGDRDEVEKQVLTEICKLRALAARGQNTQEDVKADKSLRTMSSDRANKNKLNVGHIRFKEEEEEEEERDQGVTRDTRSRPPDNEAEIDNVESPQPTHRRTLCHKDHNPLSPARFRSKDEIPSYIHHHSHLADVVDNDFDEDNPKIDQLPASDSHPHAPGSNPSQQDRAPGQTSLAPDCRCPHQKQVQGHNMSAPNQSKPQHKQCRQREKPDPNQTTEAEATAKPNLNGPQQLSTCKEKFASKPEKPHRDCSFREALWKDHFQQDGDAFPTAPETRCKHCAQADSLHPMSKGLVGDTVAAQTTLPKTPQAQESNHNSIPQNGTTLQHPAQPQLPHQTISVSHHKESGFNINFNYEGSDVGDGGMPGSRFIGQYFLELWKNQCLCDVRLRVGNWSYLAHKIVLAAFSDFFCPNDPHCMPSICFDIPNATPDAVHQILLYLYTSEMEITDYSLDSVLCAAESLGVSEVVNLVKEILENPTPENFEHYLDIRTRHGFPGRLSDYTELIREHLLDLTNSPHFLEIDIDDLQQILGDPEVKVDSEVDIIDVIARWVEFNPIERIANSADLLKFVNFDCIPAENLADVVERKRHVFSREAFSIFLDAFKARSISAECPPCPQVQNNMWPNGGGGLPNSTASRPPMGSNKSTNADIYRPGHMFPPQQAYHQPPMFYDFGETNTTQNKAVNGGNGQDNFRSPSKPRRETTRIPRSSQNKMATLLSGRATGGSGWTSDAPTSRPSTGLSSRQSSAPRRFATTQSSRMATPKEIMSMASRGDCDQGAGWVRSGSKQHRISRVGGDVQQRGRRVYRCSNGNAVFSPASDGDGNCGDTVGGATPSVGGATPLWEESNPNTSQPTSPGWSRGSGGSFVASPWMSPGYNFDSLPPGCSSFKVTRGGRGPRWEQRSRSPSAGQGSRDRSSSKRVTFVR